MSRYKIFRFRFHSSTPICNERQAKIHFRFDYSYIDMFSFIKKGVGEKERDKTDRKEKRKKDKKSKDGVSSISSSMSSEELLRLDEVKNDCRIIAMMPDA